MVNITLTDFLQLSGYRSNFEQYFKLILCVDIDDDEEFIEKECSFYNIINYQDWKVKSFDVDDDLVAIYIEKV